MFSSKKEVCTSVREGSSCIFMVKTKGCAFNDSHCRPIIPECKGVEKSCDHIVPVKDEEYCNAYMHPEIIWKTTQRCPLETHVPKEEEKQKIILDPRKAAKHRRRKA